jgi:hypothetical protein
MPATQTFAALALALVGLAACTDSFDAGSSSYAQALASRVQRHEDACVGADDSDDVQTETDGYHDDVRVWADDVSSCRAMMGMRCCCCGRGNVELSDAVVVEVARHRDVVRATSDVDDAHEECRGHRAAIERILEADPN